MDENTAVGIFCVIGVIFLILDIIVSAPPVKKSMEETISKYYGISIKDVEELKSMVGKTYTNKQHLISLLTGKFKGSTFTHNCGFTTDSMKDYDTLVVNGKKMTIITKYSYMSNSIYFVGFEIDNN